ncbi:MAG: DUF192 domain-containing protein [Spirochaetaceae bacterium]|nr:DUF192 domain-containing protein [Spirochaetaceae bacterium]
MNHFYKLTFLIILCLLIPFISCKSTVSNKRDIVIINENRLNIEIAETEKQRSLGLMHRKNLDKDSGMLFVFENDRILSFWMKDTYIPLSIAFISSDGVIKEIRDMTPLSLESIDSKNYVRYALEVNKGYFQEKNIMVGDMVILPEKYRR